MENHLKCSQTGNPSDWVENAAINFPEKPALVLAEGLITYRQLRDFSRDLGAVLRRDRIGSGTTLAVCGISGLLTPLLALTAPVVGITLFPLSAALTDKHFRRLLIESGVSGLISARRPTNLPPGVRWLDPSAFRVFTGCHDDCHVRESPLSGDDIHAIVATSGTLAGPKGVMLSGSNLGASVRASKQRLALDPDDLWLNCLPLYHLGGLAILYRCASAGATVLLHDEFDPERIWGDLVNRGVTHISLVPAMLSRLLDYSDGRTCPSSCKAVLVGGGPLSPGLANRAREAGWPLCVTYGLSETCSQCATDCGPRAGRREGWVGKPLSGFEVRIYQPDDGGVGRIRIRGPAVMAGYANPGMVRGIGLDDGWFLTSDLGYMDPDGNLRVVGRADDILVSGGEIVHPEPVEASLRGFPGIVDIAVSARKDQVWGDRLVALVVGEVDLAELASWGRSRLFRSQYPREYLKVSELPRTPMGKLDRIAIRRLVEASPERA